VLPFLTVHYFLNEAFLSSTRRQVKCSLILGVPLHFVLNQRERKSIRTENGDRECTAAIGFDRTDYEFFYLLWLVQHHPFLFPALVMGVAMEEAVAILQSSPR
jgi:hypothetical protein